MRVGFIGLGMMGKNAAANLLRAGFAVSIAVIEAMGRLRKVGACGGGYVAKLVNNQLWKIHAAAIGEAMVTAKLAGLDPLTWWEVRGDVRLYGARHVPHFLFVTSGTDGFAPMPKASGRARTAPPGRARPCRCVR